MDQYTYRGTLDPGTHLHRRAGIYWEPTGGPTFEFCNAHRQVLNIPAPSFSFDPGCTFGLSSASTHAHMLCFRDRQTRQSTQLLEGSPNWPSLTYGNKRLKHRRPGVFAALSGESSEFCILEG